jgi:hypothetical protein
MAPSVTFLGLRSFPPDGLDAGVRPEGLVQTSDSTWRGVLQADYTTQPEDDVSPRLMVAVLVHPCGEELVLPAEFGLWPTAATAADEPAVPSASRQHRGIPRVVLELPEAGEYRVELREARLVRSAPPELVPGGQTYAMIRFWRR